MSAPCCIEERRCDRCGTTTLHDVWYREHKLVREGWGSRPVMYAEQKCCRCGERYTVRL